MNQYTFRIYFGPYPYEDKIVKGSSLENAELRLRQHLKKWPFKKKVKRMECISATLKERR